MTHGYHMVDVFGLGDFSGNPLAVIADAQGLGDADLLRIANWLNLPETTFLLPPTDPEADYRVRIFTPTGELPFAGHPTLGTCHAWLSMGNRPRRPGLVVQQCGVGLVPVRRDGAGRLAFAAPPLIRSGPLDAETLERAVRVLGIGRSDVVEAVWADNGPGWLAIRLPSVEAVLALRPQARPEDRLFIGVAAAREGGETAYEVRAFTVENGVALEDPVTGSFNASLAIHLLGSGQGRAPYVAAQGTALGRSGRVYVDQDAEGRIWVGGQTKTLFVGERLF